MINKKLLKQSRRIEKAAREMQEKADSIPDPREIQKMLFARNQKIIAFYSAKR